MEVTGQVLSVQPLTGGAWGITLGPGPNVFYLALRRPEPPKLGSTLRCAGTVVARREIASGTVRGIWTKLDVEGDGGDVTLDKAESEAVAALRPKRVVDPVWVERCDRIFARPWVGPYQAEGAAWVAERLALGKGSLLADEQGLGKTQQAVAAVFAAGKLPALVLCPSILKAEWKSQLAHLAVPYEVQILSGGIGRLEPATIYIANYEIVKSREAQFMQVGFRSLICDEAHRLKEPRPTHTHRAAVITRLSHWIGPTVLLTGTPMLNRPNELWRLLHLSDPFRFPHYDLFVERFCRVSSDEELAAEAPRRRIVTSFGRAERVDELQTLIEPVMLRRMKSDVLDELPEKSRRSVLVELEDADRVEYESAKKDILKWLRDRGGGPMARRGAGIEAIVKLGVLRQIAARGKLKKAVPQYLESWFCQTTAPKPLIVFGFHQEICAKMVDIARNFGIKTSVIAGTAIESVRRRNIDEFLGGKTELMVASILAAGVGLNLQRASDALFVERDWVPANLLQAEDRIHRVGQTRGVIITYMDAIDTVDIHMGKVLEGKTQLIQQLIDGASSGAPSGLEAALSGA